MSVKFADKSNTRRVRFTTGVHHDGKDYGPDHKEQEADVDAASALSYTQQGRALYADVPGVSGGADGQIVPDEETVIGTGSSVRAVVGGGAIGVDAKAGLDTKTKGAGKELVDTKDTGKAKAK